ncbi:MAG: T9SS type A sorting domain-containing protein, partial [bacterium]
DGSAVAYGDTIIFFCDGANLLMNHTAHSRHTLIAGRELLNVEEPSYPAPQQFSLHQNYPNPFNAATTIVYDVKKTGPVSLKIFDLLGREVATLVQGTVPVGFYRVSWEAANLPSGIYLCRMEAPGFVQTQKLVLVK